MLNLPFHHLGVATKGIERELPIYQSLGYQPCSNIFVDERQKIRGLFIKADTAPTLELLENLEEHGPLDTLIDKGIKIYHLAYVTRQIEKDALRLKEECHAKIFQPIAPASFFAYVCFAMLPNLNMVELVQLKENHGFF